MVWIKDNKTAINKIRTIVLLMIIIEMEEQLMYWCVAGVSSVCIFPGKFPERNRSYTEVATFMATYNIGDPKAWITPKNLDQILEGKLVFGVIDKFTSKVRWCDIW